MQNTHWIQGDNSCESPLFRRSFPLSRFPAHAKLQVCGLGYFHLYMNGRRISREEFAPAMTCYSSTLGCDTAYPVWEERAAYRTLYLEYDLTPYLTEGINVMGFHLGNGWYHQTRRRAEGTFPFGFPKLRFELTLTWQDGETTVLESDPRTLWKPGWITENNLFRGETQDFRLMQDDWCAPEADLSGWQPARPSHAPETLLAKQDCPADTVLRTFTPILLREDKGKKLYDCGENIAGWVTVRCCGRPGEAVIVKHAEELADHGHSLDFASAGGEAQIQEDVYLCGAAPREAHPAFTWHGFRYFQVEGPGEALSASQVCTDISVTSSFRCSDPVLNWFYDTYIRTQRNNYHGCIPSDCPHRERLGYTGDGQLTCEAAMLTLDTKRLYEKWYRDILDSQGADTGHIPHTAPFLGGGGGPGGWGGAVYIVPMAYYRIYGDTGLIESGYPAILRWLEYMDSRCLDGLIVREEEGGWCLGEWCAPPTDEGMVPAEYVNTYYYILGMRAFGQMGEILHRGRPLWLEERIHVCEEAMTRAYFDPSTGDFCGGRGGANAFALNLGLGDGRTRENLIARYRASKALDTGIFGTPILLERLFAEGQADLAIRLMTNGQTSFRHMMEAGATTLWEYWDGHASHDHPMFGSAVKLLFTEILGIRQREGSRGFTNYFLKPAAVTGLQWAEGSVRTPAGVISVRWNRREDGGMDIVSHCV
ncbi:MAG: family 78 glycoside hydrolase catalytic domain [Lachnospiraceae bacterium]|nr:family 78 glycoside hydrolase catalytic domain [uncultured Acetatifactor sp.]MCI9218603.1 family 78 glycoside hydrolase catalytic domain [Lachnospiraceae bacterium]